MSNQAEGSPILPRARRAVVFTNRAGKQQRTAWFSTRDRAYRALAIIRARYGNGILYVD